MNAHFRLWKPLAWKAAWLVLLSPAALGQGELVWIQPKNGAGFRAGAEVPVQLTAYAPDDVFPSGELFANNALLAQLSLCCWFCPCAYPIAGITTTLQIPGPHELDRPGKVRFLTI